VAASTLKPPFQPQLKYEVDMRYRTSIPDNTKHWQVFEDDQQINRFLEMMNSFSSTHIDEDDGLQAESKIPPEPSFPKYIANHKIMHLKNHFIPKGLVPLEQLFYHDYVPFS